MRFGTRWNVATGDTEEWLADALAASESMGEDERATLRRLAEIVDARLEEEYELGMEEADYGVWFDDEAGTVVAVPPPPRSEVPASEGGS